MSKSLPYLIEAPKSGGGRYRFFAATIEDAGEIIDRFGGAAAQLSGEVSLYKDARGDNTFHSVAYLGEFEEGEVMS
tara:strand:+ start:744 stop:971 length:228 start_codon:yes stop_codon:yes gene_type:complete